MWPPDAAHGRIPALFRVPSVDGMINDSTRFLVEFARHPQTVGAVAPSGNALSRSIIAPVPRTGEPTVLELGPGTGAFTAHIQHRLNGRGRHLAVELNDRFARQIAQRHHAVDVVIGDASGIREILRERDLPAADVIISGLPWALFTPDRQGRILDAVAAGLTTNGVFTTFAYLHALWSPPARRLRAALHARFDEVVRERAIWANLPPATVYHCRRPHPLGS